MQTAKPYAAVLVDRYRLGRVLGAGGHGVVHEAEDLALGGVFALKILKRTGPRSLSRFKQEFRALAGVRHPNLVGLHELVADGASWFFTMDLIDGASLFDHFGPFTGPRTVGTRTATTVRAPLNDAALEDVGALFSPRAAQPAIAIERLAPALLGLAQGLSALHAAGKLHCDVKPSNVLVERATGRVVLADFGLVTGTGKGQGEVAGTPAYMAPEQVAGAPLDEASDWYAFGVLLFEALTGRLPFEGSAACLLEMKRHLEAPRAASFAESIPEDLCALSERLLDRDPARRPRARDVLALFGALATQTAPPSRRAPVSTRSYAVSETSTFVGRAHELGLLAAALDHAKNGAPALALVTGASGLGKTTLCERALEVAASANTCVLRGRCYEHESVPYQGFDAIVDALVVEIGSATHARRDLHDLAALFPATFGELPPESSQDPLERRKRAFGAMRELLRELSSTRTVAIFIDDAQWIDPDGAALLVELLRGVDAPPIAILLAARPGASVASTLEAAWRGTVAIEQLELAPLLASEAVDLAHALLDHADLGDARVRAETAREVAAEGGGSPLFVQALARHARTHHATPRTASFQDLVAAKVQALSPVARTMLEVLAVAGHPVGDRELLRAASVVDPSALYELFAARLAGPAMKTRRGAQVAVDHDRVRDVVRASIAVDVARGHHLAIARAIAASSEPDPEALGLHYREGGDRPRAAEHTAVAADRAARALAFDRAEQLYRAAIDLEGGDSVRCGSLRASLGEVLTILGRGREAADCFLAAADVEGARASALDLRRRAAEQLLRAGQVDRGLAVLEVVLRAVGLPVLRGRVAVVASLLANRALVRVQTALPHALRPSAVSREDLARADVCWSAATGLGLTDPLLSLDFSARHTRIALATGEPLRVVRALGAELLWCGATGDRSKRPARILTEAAHVASTSREPLVHAIVKGSRAIHASQLSRFREARSLGEDAERYAAEHLIGASWELTMCQHFVNWSLFHLGALRELHRRVTTLLAAACARGDRFASADLRSHYANTVFLARGEVAEARRHVEEAERGWPQSSVMVQHYNTLLARTQIELYAGDYVRAHRRVEDAFADLQRSQLLRIEGLRVDAWFLRGRAALAVRTSAGREIAHDAAHRLEREASPAAAGWALLLRAGIAGVGGDVDATRARLEHAERALRSADVNLHADLAARARASLEGTTAPAAERAIADEGVVAPERLAAVFTPGLV
jgi:serine/threonine protein kinase